MLMLVLLAQMEGVFGGGSTTSPGPKGTFGQCDSSVLGSSDGYHQYRCKNGNFVRAFDAEKRMADEGNERRAILVAMAKRCLTDKERKRLLDFGELPNTEAMTPYSEAEKRHEMLDLFYQQAKLCALKANATSGDKATLFEVASETKLERKARTRKVTREVEEVTDYDVVPGQ